DREDGGERARHPAGGSAHQPVRRNLCDGRRQRQQAASPQDCGRDPRRGPGAGHRRSGERPARGDDRRLRAVQAGRRNPDEDESADCADQGRRRTGRDMTRPAGEDSDRYWFARHSQSIIFLISTLAAIGIVAAVTLPVAVFPTTNFPRIIIGIDNGVMPIEQMEVAITRPIEEIVRTVPGLEDVRSVTSRGSAEIDLFFSWSVDMLETLQLVDAAVSRVQSTLPPTVQIRTNRLAFASFPIIGYS